MSNTPDKHSMIEQLKREIEDIKNRMPYHSVKPELISELEEKEEELQELLKEEE